MTFKPNQEQAAIGKAFTLEVAAAQREYEEGVAAAREAYKTRPKDRFWSLKQPSLDEFAKVEGELRARMEARKAEARRVREMRAKVAAQRRNAQERQAAVDWIDDATKAKDHEG